MAADATALRLAISDAALPIIEDAGRALERELAAAAPIDTGELSQSGEVTAQPAGTGASASVTFTAEHASFLDSGTGPHEITGNPFLAFDVGGQTVVVRSVQHPGSTKHRGWFSDRVRDSGPVLLQTAADTHLR